MSMAKAAPAPGPVLPAPSKKYGKFDKGLQLELKTIGIVDEERKHYMKAFLAFQTDLVSALKEEDVVFEALFKRLHATGSSFEGLRISHPNEFDMNAILGLPLQKQDDMQIKKCGHAGHMCLRLQQDPGQYYSESWFTSRFKKSTETIAAQLKKWWTGGFLDREKVLQWLQGAVTKAVSKLRENKHLPTWTYVKDIIQKRSGPAVTLDVRGKEGKDFSVDLVPTLPFSVESLPKGMKGRVKEKSGKTPRDWHLIPKGYSREADSKVWRASMWDHERDLINGLEHFKPFVRLLKKLRDVQKWQFLASYFLKTSAMLVLEKEPAGFFGKGIGEILVKGLSHLENMVRECVIPFFWDKNHNLLAGVNKDTCSNVANRLQVIRQSFEKSFTNPKEDPMRFFQDK